MTTTIDIPQLEHLQPEPTWLPADLPERIEPTWVQARFDEILAACAAAADGPAWIDIVLRTSELEAFIHSHGARIGLAYRQATDDDAANEAYQRWNREVSPVVSDASVEVARAIAASPHAAAIDERFGSHYLQLVRAAVRSQDPINTALRTEISDVLMRHTRIFGTAKITWRGEQHPFSFLRKAALDEDRAERHGAWHSAIDYVRSHEDELQAVFDEARALRTKMAHNLGMDSFVDLRYLEMQRFDWDRTDAARVRAAIVEHVVPITRAMDEAQARELGTERLHPADGSIEAEAPPRLAVGIDGELDAAVAMFDAMGPAFGDPFRMMVDERLIDLPARAGKGAGAFCTNFPFEAVPYIFCNSVGTYGDARTLVHEYGHALQGWRSREIEPIDLRSPTFEACEIHSMTLELLAAPHMAPLFGDDLEKFRLRALRGTISSVPYLASIDAFQHRVYEEDLDAAGRAEAWAQIAREYQPGIDWDADEWYGRNRWMLQLHVFQYPFYYLDYALARLVSWDLWLRSLDDRDGAIATYLELCSAGGTKPFRQLVLDAGLGDPFDPDVIADTVRRLTPHLKLG
jgi:M3 family oligoendopeptidase